ncbi:MAG: serine/threonine-protein kinase [Myxococcota bacterium]
MDSSTPIAGGRFVISRPLGRGAASVVYLGRHEALGLPVAIKMIDKGLVDHHPEASRRFLREAKAISLLRHRNTVRVIDFGEEDGRIWLAMELLEGRRLCDAMADDGAFSVARAVTIAAEILASLAEAHDHGIVHCDIKPGNVMLEPSLDDDGQPIEVVKVIDFGVASIVAEDRVRDNPAGLVIGTPTYMSPEQGEGLSLDPRSDLYSVGVTLYEMLAQRAPFERESPLETLTAHAVEEVPTAPLVAVSPALRAVVLRALAQRPAERYPDARAMRAALLDALAGDSGARLRAGPRTSLRSHTATRPQLPAAEDAHGTMVVTGLVSTSRAPAARRAAARSGGSASARWRCWRRSRWRSAPAARARRRSRRRRPRGRPRPRSWRRSRRRRARRRRARRSRRRWPRPSRQRP